MLIAKYRDTLRPEQMIRLAERFNALRDELGGPVLVLDADCQLFQHVDGRWAELGQAVEDLDQFPDLPPVEWPVVTRRYPVNIGAELLDAIPSLSEEDRKAVRELIVKAALNLGVRLIDDATHNGAGFLIHPEQGGDIDR